MNLEGRQLTSPETPAIVNGFAKGELARSCFRICSQPPSLFQTSYVLFLVPLFSAYRSVLAGQNDYYIPRVVALSVAIAVVFS